MPNVDVDLYAVVVAALVNMIIGTIWYLPGVFGKDWSKLTGRKLDEMGKGDGMAVSYGLTALGALVQSWILAHFVVYAGAITAIQGAEVGLWLWIGFVAITQGVNTIFAGSRKRLWAINTLFFLVVLLINGALLAAWK